MILYYQINILIDFRVNGFWNLDFLFDNKKFYELS